MDKHHAVCLFLCAKIHVGFESRGRNREWTLLVDTFNHEILPYQATPITGSCSGCPKILDEYVYCFHNSRPAAALDYKYTREQQYVVHGCKTKSEHRMVCDNYISGSSARPETVTVKFASSKL